MLNNCPALIEAFLQTFVARLSEIPAEKEFQEEIAERLRTQTVKTFREARYPGIPSPALGTMNIDVVVVDGQYETWLEVKLFKHLSSLGAKSTKLDSGQGIPAMISRDCSKLRNLPGTVSKGFIAIGLFEDHSTSNRYVAAERAIAAEVSVQPYRAGPFAISVPAIPELQELIIWFVEVN